jgi:hypothetical protein
MTPWRESVIRSGVKILEIVGLVFALGAWLAHEWWVQPAREDHARVWSRLERIVDGANNTSGIGIAALAAAGVWHEGSPMPYLPIREEWVSIPVRQAWQVRAFNLEKDIGQIFMALDDLAQDGDPVVAAYRDSIEALEDSLRFYRTRAHFLARTWVEDEIEPALDESFIYSHRVEELVSRGFHELFYDPLLERSQVLERRIENRSRLYAWVFVLSAALAILCKLIEALQPKRPARRNVGVADQDRGSVRTALDTGVTTRAATEPQPTPMADPAE